MINELPLAWEDSLGDQGCFTFFKMLSSFFHRNWGKGLFFSSSKNYVCVLRLSLKDLLLKFCFDSRFDVQFDFNFDFHFVVLSEQIFQLCFQNRNCSLCFFCSYHYRIIEWCSRNQVQELHLFHTLIRLMFITDFVHINYSFDSRDWIMSLFFYSLKLVVLILAIVQTKRVNKNEYSHIWQIIHCLFLFLRFLSLTLFLCFELRRLILSVLILFWEGKPFWNGYLSEEDFHECFCYMDYLLTSSSIHLGKLQNWNLISLQE